LLYEDTWCRARRVVGTFWPLFSNTYARTKAANILQRIFDKELSRRPSGYEYSVLDAGCGNGTDVFMLRARAKYWRRIVRFQGIDISSVAVEWARRRAEESGSFDCSFEKRDLNQKLQYKDEAFDIILCLEVLEHLEEPYNVISEFFRVIRKGGLLIMSTPNKDYPLASMLGKWKSMLEQGNDEWELVEASRRHK
jgi:2-polyprenyl-3-methyl-5-hydroxy-6-metoxy-1,4-benzoquinol methylase